MDAAIRTGVLSKRFAYQWASTPNLVFDQRSDWERPESLNDFITFVNRTLLLHDPNCKVQKFTIYMDYMYQVIENSLEEDCVTLWLRFATRKGVEELNLEFNDDEDPYDYSELHDTYRYLLPQFVFRHSSSRKLATRFCNFVTYGVVSWTWLKSLSIGYAELNEEAIRNILMGSPVLEFLKLQRCHGFARINICSGSLKTLSIVQAWDPNDAEGETVLQVSAPNIRSLELSGIWKKMCRLLDMSSLVNAKLNIQMLEEDRESQYSIEDCSNMLTEILKKLSHVEELTVGTWCLENLKIIKIVGFNRWVRDIQFAIAFIEFLLKNAKVLEKMVINVPKVKGQTSAASQELSVVQKLLSFTRASPRAAVLFSGDIENSSVLVGNSQEF